MLGRKKDSGKDIFHILKLNFKFVEKEDPYDPTVKKKQFTLDSQILGKYSFISSDLNLK